MNTLFKWFKKKPNCEDCKWIKITPTTTECLNPKCWDEFKWAFCDVARGINNYKDFPGLCGKYGKFFEKEASISGKEEVLNDGHVMGFFLSLIEKPKS